MCEKSSGRFATDGTVTRLDARCPWCDAFERHRLLWLYLQRCTDLFDGASRKMLHVAPEPCFQPSLRQALGDGYLTADLSDPGAMVKMDVTDIQYPDDSFDVVLCSHVLEHVPDDRRAMRELRRVLKPSGWAILLVPITADETFEDLGVVDPMERYRLFGQDDHVRRYGPDYRDRLSDAGFSVEEVATDFVTETERVRMGLTAAAGEIFRCT